MSHILEDVYSPLTTTYRLVTQRPGTDAGGSEPQHHVAHIQHRATNTHNTWVPREPGGNMVPRGTETTMRKESAYARSLGLSLQYMATTNHARPPL